MSSNPFSKLLPHHHHKKKKKKDEDASQEEEEEQQSLLGRLHLKRRSEPPATPSTETYSPLSTYRTWDVKMPPAKKTMISGRLVPNPNSHLTGFVRQKKSRIVIEIHSSSGVDSPKSTSSSSPTSAKKQADETNIARGLLRGKSMKVQQETLVLHDNETVVMRILRPSRGRGDKHADSDDGDDDEQGSVSTLGHQGVDEQLEDGKWSEAYLFDPDDVELLKHSGSHVECKLGRGAETMVRTIYFSSEQEKESFVDVISKLGVLLKERATRKLESLPQVGNELNILVEIVSGVRLPIADITSTDAYVVVYLGKDEVHRTKQIPNTINPIWTIDNGSLFLLQTTPQVFFGSSTGLTFSVRDYDVMGKNDVLGKVTIQQEELIEGKGERREYPLVLDKAHKKAKDARLVLRFRLATPNDVEFMRTFDAQKKKHKVGAYSNEAFVPVRSLGVALPGMAMLKREWRKTKSGEREFRVKPEPDPSRPEETKWMTESQIDEEAFKPSTNWIEVGSGGLGKIYIELINCHGLPNMDTGVIDGKTDAFASLIFEDAIVNTDVINDTLSPRWLPWTQRAFIFNVLHPSSQIMLGVFDFDSQSPLDSHDPIGRISIDVTNLRPCTDYTMTFDLYTSALVTTRKSNGTVTVRLRVEWENERKALLASAKVAPDIYVNVSQPRDFLCAHYTTVGQYNVQAYDMDTLTSYIDELQGYESLLHVFKEAAFTVLLWRGHFPVTFWVPSIPLEPVDPDHPKRFLRRLFKPVVYKLAIHSFVAFIGGIILAEDYNFFPSYLLLMIGWILLASNEYQNQNPSPWKRKRSYWELWQVLLFNRSATDTIDPDQNKEEVLKYLQDKQKLEEERAAEAKKKQEAAEKEAAELQQELAEEAAQEEDLETKKTGWGVSVQPLKPFLYPLQQNLGKVVVAVRIARSIVTWEECHAAFWMTNACFLAGLLLLGVPWDWLIHWTFRIIVWVFLGPWMKLIDIFLVKGRTREEMKKKAQERLRLKYQEIVEARRFRQINREDAKKLKYMKRYMFGKYLISVPRFKEARWIDKPLLQSHASPHVSTLPEHVSASFFGQHLEGCMIPDREANQKAKEESETSALLNADEDTPKYGSTDEGGLMSKVRGVLPIGKKD